MSSPVLKRSVVLSGHKTSMSLEEPFWQALREIARERGITTSALLNSIASKRVESNLSSALRVAVLEPSALPAKRNGRLVKQTGRGSGSQYKPLISWCQFASRSAGAR